MLTIGIDLVEIRNVQILYRKYGHKFLELVCTPAEYEWCSGNPVFISELFAIKESIAKALGVGLDYLSLEGIRLTEAEVIPLDNGRFETRLYGRAQEYATELGISQWSVSVDQRHGYVIATAVAL